MTYTIKTDEQGIINSIADDGVITFNSGKTGSATVTIGWTYDDGISYFSGTKDIVVTVKAPVIEHDWDYENIEWIWTEAENGYTAVAKLICKDDSSHTKVIDAIVSGPVDNVFTATITGPDGNIYTDTKKISVPTYTVTFDTNGGSEIEMQTIEEGGEATKPEDPVKEGCFEFVDWYQDQKLTDKYDFTSVVTENITIYAKWKEKHISGEVVRENEASATCEKTGSYDEAVYCTECGEELSREEKTIPATGHSWTFKEFTWTKTEEGYTAEAAYECGNNAEHKRAVTATITVTSSDATCTEAGTATYTAAVSAENAPDGESRTDSKVITGEALGHDWGEPTYEWSQDNSTVTATRVCANDETHTESVTVHTTYEVTTEATCSAAGKGTYTAVFTNNVYTTQTKEVEIEKIAHTPGEAVKENEVAATCEKAGSYNEVVYCTGCGAQLRREAKTIPATGHTEVVIKGKAATETATGLTDGKKCSVCGKILVVQKVIPKLASSVSTVIPAEISPSSPVSASSVESQIVNVQTDNDPKGSVFSLLQAKGTAKDKTTVKISWKKVSGAAAYIIYGNKCGKKNRYKKITTVTGTSFTQKKLKKGTYYKYLIVAVNGNKALATSKTVHVATKGGKVGNYKSVTTKAKKNKVTLKTGKTFKLKAKAIAQSKKLKVKKHRAIVYESNNRAVASVSAKGVIKAVGKGTCYVYAYAQNGVCRKIKVTVK